MTPIKELSSAQFTSVYDAFFCAHYISRKFMRDSGKTEGQTNCINSRSVMNFWQKFQKLDKNLKKISVSSANANFR